MRAPTTHAALLAAMIMICGACRAPMLAGFQSAALRAQNNRLNRDLRLGRSSYRQTLQRSPSVNRPESFYTTTVRPPKNYLADSPPVPPREGFSEALAGWYGERSPASPQPLKLFDDAESVTAQTKTETETSIAKTAAGVKSPDSSPKSKPVGDAEFRFVTPGGTASGGTPGRLLFDARPMGGGGSSGPHWGVVSSDGGPQLKDRVASGDAAKNIDISVPPVSVAPVSGKAESRRSNPLRRVGSEQPYVVAPATWATDSPTSPIREPRSSNPLRP